MSTWEERMAACAAERAARRRAEEPEPDPLGMPAGHEDHHWHLQGNGYICSCGQYAGGIWSFIPDPRWWSDDPAERAQVEREEADWQAWITCHICGEHGVTAADVSWPPQ